MTQATLQEVVCSIDSSYKQLGSHADAYYFDDIEPTVQHNINDIKAVMAKKGYKLASEHYKEIQGQLYSVKLGFVKNVGKPGEIGSIKIVYGFK